MRGSECTLRTSACRRLLPKFEIRPSFIIFVAQVFSNCVQDGVNLFDTAEVYGLGRSEYLCGKFRRDYKGPDKDGIVIGEILF